MPRSPRGSRVSNFAGHWAAARPVGGAVLLARPPIAPGRPGVTHHPAPIRSTDRGYAKFDGVRSAIAGWLGPKGGPMTNRGLTPTDGGQSAETSNGKCTRWVRRCLHTPSCSPTTTKRPWRTCSSNLQQQMRGLVVLNASICGWLGTNDVQRCPLRHFASRRQGLIQTMTCSALEFAEDID